MLELDAKGLTHPTAGLSHQRQAVCRRRLARVLDEVRMLLGDEGAAVPVSLEPAELDPHTTAGKLLFSGDLGGNLIAHNPVNGKILWHSRVGMVTNAPETYMIDGHQYVLVAAGDSLYSFTLY